MGGGREGRGGTKAGDLIKQISPWWGLLIIAKSHRHHLGLEAVNYLVTTWLPVALHYHGVA